MLGRVESRESRVESQNRSGSEERGAKNRRCPSAVAPRSSLLVPRRRGVLLARRAEHARVVHADRHGVLDEQQQYEPGAKESARVNRLGNDAGKLLTARSCSYCATRIIPLPRFASTACCAICTAPRVLAEVYSPLALEPELFNAGKPVPALCRRQAELRGDGTDLGSVDRHLCTPASDRLERHVNDRQRFRWPPSIRGMCWLSIAMRGGLQSLALSLTRGYYNGCVLTMTSGPAAGQSTRIVDYEYIGEAQTLRMPPLRPPNRDCFVFA